MQLGLCVPDPPPMQFAVCSNSERCTSFSCGLLRMLQEKKKLHAKNLDKRMDTTLMIIIYDAKQILNGA